MIGKLTLYYNRTRQAVITRELIEIISGASALDSKEQKIKYRQKKKERAALPSKISRIFTYFLKIYTNSFYSKMILLLLLLLLLLYINKF